ncbi:protein ASI3 [Cladorrhinum samala]|uniref:Protein ASI3 n=1 Tax=Cladorrhinum samala TaxID=585594 RepID=A0AAV9HPY5_9PEZI|nr:protein ASI3 [Cladorrhinum samala]
MGIKMEETSIIPEAALAVTSLPAAPVMDNATVWRNFTLWTAQHLGMAVNMSKLAPSLEDLVLAGPRMVMKLGRLGSFISFPDAIDSYGQRYIPDQTEVNVFASSSGPASIITSGQSTTSSSTASMMSAAASAAAAATVKDPKVTSRLTAESARGLGSVFGYATSKWALCCIAMALILNRTAIFAATRRRLKLRWPFRLFLRLPPMIALLWQARRLLQSIQCQTSPDFAELRWGNTTKSSDLMFSQTNTFFHGVSQTLLFGATDPESCYSVRMVPWGDGQEQLVGSLSRLWPLFLTFCVSQFVEVLSCTVQGRPMAAETGTTLFEHSLAFAEADAAISNQLGWNLFTNSSNVASSDAGPVIAVTRAMIMNRVNTPPEVLVVAFLSAMSHVTSHILGCFDVQRKYRLFSTGFWGLCFMASIAWSIATFSIYDNSSQGLLRYPTISIIGFIPHILILTGISACGVIYFIALAISALAVPERGSDAEQLTFRQRFISAHNNMQANLSLSDVRIRREMDFYTALLRAGFYAITMASEAVYLNEDHKVNLKPYTWLEEERMREIETLKMQWIGRSIPGSRYDSADTIGLVPVKEGEATATSGYAREKAAQQISKKDSTNRKAPNGVGAAERSSRWLMAVEYMMYISRLIIMTWALCTVKIFTYIGWRNPPRWLKGLSQRPKSSTAENKKPRQDQSHRAGTNADVLAPGGGKPFFHVPRNDRVDVEGMLRRRIDNGDGDEAGANRPVDEAVDSMLYSYFLRNGWWGGNDSSGDYVPPEYVDREPEFDTTSIISTTETGSVDGWETDPDSENDNDNSTSGQRTPTQASHETFASAVLASRESTPAPYIDTPMAPSDMARLLNPQTPEDREEALALAAHLASDKILTRSSFKQQLARQRAQLLLTTNYHRRPGALEKMTPEEEARSLEQLLLSKRKFSQQTGTSKEPGEWASGAAGLGADGPQCVVCQCAPRTIIVWPCRCLSLCDECRVSLAMNNFDKCVCCRREVFSFSRIYVP